MLPGLRASKLQIDWRDASQVRMVTVSFVDLEIDYDCVPETVLDIFPDDHSWLGLQVPDGIVPSWRSAEGDRAFLRIVAPDGEVWWIPASGWNAGRRRHDNAFVRGLGQFDVAIGAETLRIVTRHHEGVMLGDYLRDFRDELIWLILGQEGSGGVVRGAGSDMATAFGSFVKAALSLAADLPRDLQESIGPMRRSKVRPNAATFRVLGRAPWAQVLPGRVAKAEANISDNRYLRHLIQSALALVQAVSKAGQAQAEALDRRAAHLEEIGRELIEREWQEVDPEVFDAQLHEYERRMEPILQWRPVVTSGEQLFRRRFEIQKPYGTSGASFFVRDVDAGDVERDYWPQVLRLPNEVGDLIGGVSALERRFDFAFTRGGRVKTKETFSNGKPYWLHEISHVEAIRPNGLEVRRQRRANLETSGWRTQLDRKAREEYKQAGRVSMSRAEHYRSRAQAAARLSDDLAAGCACLASLDRELQGLGVGLSATPPQGLRWRLHPPHVTCLAAFRQLQEAAHNHGLDTGALERLDVVATLHASALYERWCLVKILLVLISDYGFQPGEGWQSLLVDAVTRPDGRITLDLLRPDLLLGARLQVQPTLKNGRRPDFRLRVTYLPRVPTTDVRDKLFSQAPGLVMDAKFRSRWAMGEVSEMVEALVRQKGYGNEGDAVFVLQPCGKTVQQRNSPLDWGPHCDHGQDHPRDHLQGHIWLAPNADPADPQVHLRRLIGQLMQACFARPTGVPLDARTQFFEELFENADRGPGGERGDYQDVPLVSASFCISCGKVHGDGDAVSNWTGKSGRGREYWVLGCKACGMSVTRTHCHGCGERVLFKNHLRMTYHRTIADQPTHVVCPQCGADFL
ncbi:zinc ribbon domain-containing protein [Paracoccus sp. SSK6]|uniref:zinc ribbon domain-containing protein n=1 Tax=Paracoccus sp. SSK6 TaxID=3143131 RepID=UPI0032190938